MSFSLILLSVGTLTAFEEAIVASVRVFWGASDITERCSGSSSGRRTASWCVWVADWFAAVVLSVAARAGLQHGHYPQQGVILSGSDAKYDAQLGVSLGY